MSTTRDYLQDLANEPIRTAERASKIWLPAGRKKAPPRPEDEKAAARANASAARAREQVERPAKLAQLLDYYAQTTVPVGRVASHCGISEADALAELAKRGRA